MILLNTILDLVLIASIGYYVYYQRNNKKFINKSVDSISETLKDYKESTFKNMESALNVIMIYYAEREMYKEAEEVKQAIKELEKLNK